MQQPHFTLVNRVALHFRLETLEPDYFPGAQAFKLRH